MLPGLEHQMEDKLNIHTPVKENEKICKWTKAVLTHFDSFLLMFLLMSFLTCLPGLDPVFRFSTILAVPAQAFNNKFCVIRASR